MRVVVVAAAAGSTHLADELLISCSMLVQSRRRRLIVLSIDRISLVLVSRLALSPFSWPFFAFTAAWFASSSLRICSSCCLARLPTTQ